MKLGEDQSVEPRIIKIDTFLYEKICHLRLVSLEIGGGQNYMCYVALQRKKIRQIDLFDISDPRNAVSTVAENLLDTSMNATFMIQQSLQNDVEKELRTRQKKTINYSIEPSESTRVFISPCTSQVALANGTENFIMVTRGRDLIQKSLPQLKGKTVRFIEFDEDLGEFFFACCFEYDHQLDIQSSIRNDFDIAFIKDIEPGCIEVFDIDVMSTPLEGDQHKTKKEIRLASLKDRDFHYECVSFLQEKNDECDFQNSLNQDIKIEDPQYYQNISQPIKAFYHCWPYVSFTGLKENVVFLVNAFEREFIHRIQIVDDEDCHHSHFQILATRITNSLDLIIMCHSKGKYQLFKINLDKSNRLELRDRNDTDEDYFKPELIFEYTED